LGRGSKAGLSIQGGSRSSNGGIEVIEPQFIAGWWFQPTPLKNIKVSWDDDIPNIWKNKNVPNHQPDCHFMAKSRENHGKHQPE